MKIKLKNDTGSPMSRTACADMLGYQSGLLYAWGEYGSKPQLDHTDAHLRAAFDAGLERALNEEHGA